MIDQENSNNNNLNQEDVNEGKTITPSENEKNNNLNSFSPKKKIILATIIAVLLLVFYHGINSKTELSQNLTKNSGNEQTIKEPIVHPIIGVWQHQDIPDNPQYKEWTITFNSDGTYTSEYFYNIYGKKGTFIIDKDTNTLTLFDEVKHRTSYCNKIEIANEDGKEVLLFRESRFEKSGDDKYRVTTTVFTPEPIDYLSKFIKQQ